MTLLRNALNTLRATALACTLALPAVVHAEALSGTLIAGGGIDDLSLTVQKANGQQIIVYCNNLCGDWFIEDPSTESRHLKKALRHARIELEYKAARNRGRIAGPGDDEVLNFLKKVQLQR